MKLNLTMFTLLFPLLWILTSCEKEPQIIIKTETVTIIDTLVVTDTFTIVETIIETQPDTTTTFILVRHAETTGVGNNPVLSADGEIRANELTRIMTEVDLDAIYSTNFNRTMQTTQATASAKGLTVSEYDPFNPVMLIDNVLEEFPEGIVLVVGHSNTTAALLNAMTGSNNFADIPEDQFDNLYIVHVSERGKSKVIHLKYGE